MISRRFKVVCCMLVTSCFLSGCWDAVELQQRAIVLMIGVDPASEESEGVRVSVQLALPQKLSTPPDPAATRGEDSMVVVTKTGVDVNDAVRKIQLATDRNLFFEHARALVINEAVAKRGTLSLIDAMVQSRIAPRDAWLFVSSNSAQEVLRYAPALEAIPSTYLTNFFENRLLLNRSYDATIGGFHQRFVTPGVEPFAIWIGPGVKELSAPSIKGIAAFSGDKFVGGLNQQQALGWQFLMNQFPKSPLTFTCPKPNGGKFVVNVRTVKSSVKVDGKDVNAPQASINLTMKGWIEGGACVKESSPEELDIFKKQAQGEVASLVVASLVQSRKFGSDIFGLGRDIYRYTPHDWHGDTQWRQAFQKLTATERVDVQLEFLQTYNK